MPVIDCDCPEDRLEVRKFRTGSRKRPIVYRLQCQECGRKHGGALNPLHLPEDLLPNAVKWAIPTRMKRARPNSMQRRRSAKRSSADFQAQRLRVFERDNWTCQGCGLDDDPEALEVHHVRYPEIPEDDVPDSDLQTTCGPCNLAEREERLAGGQGGRVG